MSEFSWKTFGWNEDTYNLINGRSIDDDLICKAFCVLILLILFVILNLKSLSGLPNSAMNRIQPEYLILQAVYWCDIKLKIVAPSMAFRYVAW